MPVQRAFLVWQFVAAAVLPVWLLVGYAAAGQSVGGLVGVVLLVPLVIVVQLALTLLFSARVAIRRRRALDWPPIALLTAFQVGVIGFGFYGPASAWFGVLAVLAALGGFWVAATLLVNDTRRRVQATLAQFQTPFVDRTPIDRGEYVVIKQSGR